MQTDKIANNKKEPTGLAVGCFLSPWSSMGEAS